MGGELGEGNSRVPISKFARSAHFQMLQSVERLVYKTFKALYDDNL